MVTPTFIIAEVYKLAALLKCFKINSVHTVIILIFKFVTPSLNYWEKKLGLLPELNILIYMSLESTKYSTLNKWIFVEYITVALSCSVQFICETVYVLWMHIFCVEMYVQNANSAANLSSYHLMCC